MAERVAVTAQVKPWGILATLVLGAVALLAGQFAGIAAVTVLIFVSTPVQVALLALFARRAGGNAADYLGLIWPRRSEVVFGIIAVGVFVVAGNAITWMLGRNVVTNFQVDIYRTASSAGWLPLLCFAVVAVTPIGE